MKKPHLTSWQGRGLVFVLCALTGACAEKGADPSKPASSGHKGLQERLSEGGGFKQDENGQWVPRSDKRSSFESQGDSPYFKGNVEKKKYSTGEYATKKSWWGGKEYGTKGYGDTGASRFQGAKARQDGMTANDGGKSARESGTYKTNTLDGKIARESGASQIARPLDAAVQSRRGLYKPPSVIDWQEERSMSLERSKGILGR